MNDILTYTCLHLTTPCAVTGNLGIPFFNQAMKALLNLPDRIDAEEMPLSLQLFLAQEEKGEVSNFRIARLKYDTPLLPVTAQGVAELWQVYVMSWFMLHPRFSRGPL